MVRRNNGLSWRERRQEAARDAELIKRLNGETTSKKYTRRQLLAISGASVVVGGITIAVGENFSSDKKGSAKSSASTSSSTSTPTSTPTSNSASTTTSLPLDKYAILESNGGTLDFPSASQEVHGATFQGRYVPDPRLDLGWQFDFFHFFPMLFDFANPRTSNLRTCYFGLQSPLLARDPDPQDNYLVRMSVFTDDNIDPTRYKKWGFTAEFPTDPSHPNQVHESHHYLNEAGNNGIDSLISTPITQSLGSPIDFEYDIQRVSISDDGNHAKFKARVTVNDQVVAIFTIEPPEGYIAIIPQTVFFESPYSIDPDFPRAGTQGDASRYFKSSAHNYIEVKSMATTVVQQGYGEQLEKAEPTITLQNPLIAQSQHIKTNLLRMMGKQIHTGIDNRWAVMMTHLAVTKPHIAEGNSVITFTFHLPREPDIRIPMHQVTDHSYAKLTIEQQYSLAQIGIDPPDYYLVSNQPAQGMIDEGNGVWSRKIEPEEFFIGSIELTAEQSQLYEKGHLRFASDARGILSPEEMHQANSLFLPTQMPHDISYVGALGVAR